MRIQRSLLVAALCATPTLSYGADAAAPEKKAAVTADDGAAAPARKGSDGTSAGARGMTKWGGGVNAGLVMGSIPGYGIDAMGAHNSDWQFGIGVQSGTLDLKSAVESSTASVTLTKAKATATVMQAKARWFMGNSFYLGMGLGQRKIGLAYAINGGAAGNLDGSVESSGLCASLSIGNQWMFDSGFYIGVDWLGVNAPLSSSTTSSVTGTGLASAAVKDTQKSANDAGESIGKTVSPQLLLLNLGMMF